MNSLINYEVAVLMLPAIVCLAIAAYAPDRIWRISFFLVALFVLALGFMKVTKKLNVQRPEMRKSWDFKSYR